MNATTPPKEDPSDTTTEELQDAVGPDRGGVDTDHLDLPRDAKLLGVDGAGEVHLHSPRAEWVWVIDPDAEPPAVTHEADVPEGRLEAFVDRVRDERGAWEDLRYVFGDTDPLAAVLGRAIELYEQEAER